MIVGTTHGRLNGYERDGVQIFKNIPYAATTAGEGRFRPPRPAQAWSGVRDATQVGDSSPQAALPMVGELTRMFGGGVEEHLPESEDCLNLNVFTPGVNDGAKRPVMVWLHGGHLILGSGNSGGYDGGNLARRRDVVVVSVTHRLGVLAHLYLGDLLGEEYRTSGNSGFLDIVAALEWVRDNITAFGGDPDNVTVFGESGGGRKVSFLLGMPAAKGLFHKAIIQSGSNPRALGADQAAVYAERFVRHAGLERATARRLLDMPTGQLIEAQSKVMGAQRFSNEDFAYNGVIDGVSLLASPFDPQASPLSQSIPIIVGSTKHEAALFLLADEKIRQRTLTAEEALTRLTTELGDHAHAQRLMDAYAQANPGASPAHLYILIQTDKMYTCDTVLLADRAAQRPAPVFKYQLAWESPAMGGILMACHALDVSLTFDNLDKAPSMAGDGPEAQHMADVMSEAWTTFARTGTPTAKSLPPWPAYDAAGRATMVLNTTSHIERDPGGAQRAAWL